MCIVGGANIKTVVYSSIVSVQEDETIFVLVLDTCAKRMPYKLRLENEIWEVCVCYSSY
jgi:hypothetical protein